jgi:glycosyltransferase involved in cell wall biosynthesis
VLATTAGGVAEVVSDEENGLLVPPGDIAALSAAVGRYFEDDALRERLRANAKPSVERYAPEHVFAELEATLERVAR